MVERGPLVLQLACQKGRGGGLPADQELISPLAEGLFFKGEQKSCFQSATVAYSAKTGHALQFSAMDEASTPLSQWGNTRAKGYSRPASSSLPPAIHIWGLEDAHTAVKYTHTHTTTHPYAALFLLLVPENPTSPRSLVYSILP